MLNYNETSQDSESSNLGRSIYREPISVKHLAIDLTDATTWITQTGDYKTSGLEDNLQGGLFTSDPFVPMLCLSTL